jgi:hypothetical protein
MVAGLKTVVLLSFVLALGFLLVILSSALWSNWLPLLVAATFVVAPLPNVLFARCGSVDISTEEEHNPAIDIGRFITSCVVVTGVALPVALAHAKVIHPTAASMSLSGGLLIYSTIQLYFAVFRHQEEEEF